MSILDFLFYSFVAVVSVQVLFYLIIFGRFAFSKQTQKQSNKKSISVILWAKNEVENLKLFLPSIINQDYPDFEIVIINDASSDNTLDVIEVFAEKHSNIKIVNVENNEAFWANKKYALTLGIKAAKYEHLLFTNANCKPVSKNWISEMNASILDERTIVLGYSSYIKNKSSFANKFIRLDNLLHAIQYFSFAKIGLPYAGVGQNLSYSKTTFFKSNGFINHMGLRSGEDNLFVNETAEAKHTNSCFSRDSFTIASIDFKTWYKQKQKYYDTASRYKTKHKIVLTTFLSSQALFWLLSIILLATGFNWKIVSILIITRFIFQYLTLIFSAKKLNEIDTLVLSLILEPFLVVTQLTIFISNFFSKTNHWN